MKLLENGFGWFGAFARSGLAGDSPLQQHSRPSGNLQQDPIHLAAQTPPSLSSVDYHQMLLNLDSQADVL